MADVNLSEQDLQLLREGFVLVKSFASDEYGIDSSVTVRFNNARNPKCGRQTIYGSGNKNPCLLPIGHKDDCSDESPRTLILSDEEGREKSGG